MGSETLDTLHLSIRYFNNFGCVYILCASESLAIMTSLYLLIEETEGTLSWLHTPSDKSRSLISHANIVGFSRLYFAMALTTNGVATLGLEPPITPAL